MVDEGAHMKTRPLAVLVVCALSAFAAPSAAASIFLNGVNIDGVVNQTFENCTVKIDDKGNVLIIAKGYEVRTTTTPATPTATSSSIKPKSAPPTMTATSPTRSAEPVTKQYFLVSETSTPALAQYDVDVFINHVWIKRIVATEGQLVVDVSKHLRKGNNTVHFTAKKNLSEGRKSEAAGHSLTLHLGEGSVTGNQVVLDRPLVQYVRTAAELEDFDDDIVILAR
jgi:hypothetical protein